jgi:hypothetical protein
MRAPRAGRVRGHRGPSYRIWISTNYIDMAQAPALEWQQDVAVGHGDAAVQPDRQC